MTHTTYVAGPKNDIPSKLMACQLVPVNDADVKDFTSPVGSIIIMGSGIVFAGLPDAHNCTRLLGRYPTPSVNIVAPFPHVSVPADPLPIVPDHRIK